MGSACPGHVIEQHPLSVSFKEMEVFRLGVHRAIRKPFESREIRVKVRLVNAAATTEAVTIAVVCDHWFEPELRGGMVKVLITTILEH